MPGLCCMSASRASTRPGPPSNESIVGWVLVDHKLAYVVLVNLDLDQPPTTELDLLTKQPE